MTWQNSRVGGQPGQVITDEAARHGERLLVGCITASLSESRGVDVQKEMDELVPDSAPDNARSLRDAVK